MNVMTSALTLAVHPAGGSGTGAATPAGSRMSRPTVGEPSHPCSTVNPTLTSLPAGASGGSGSMWARAGEAVASTPSTVTAAVATTLRAVR